MKGILVGTLLALPLVMASLSSQASAADLILRTDVHRDHLVALVRNAGIAPTTACSFSFFRRLN